MQRILLVAALVAAGLTGCANPGPNNKPYTSIPPAPSQPPRPDQGAFPDGRVADVDPSSPNFANPRSASNQGQPTFSNPNTPLPPPNFPTGPGPSGSVSNSSFVPRRRTWHRPRSRLHREPRCRALRCRALRMPSVPTSDFSRVGAPTYPMNQGMSQPPQYGQMPQSPPAYSQPLTTSTLPPAMPNVNVMSPMPSAPPIGMPTSQVNTYPSMPLRGQ